jgi:hypothetical protein
VVSQIRWGPDGEALADSAGDVAERLLAVDQPLRWAHVRSVAGRAAGWAVGLDDADVVIASAWLHDIGYAADLVDTGFHPLDGARFLRALGWPDEVATLVAHHTSARVEAAERGLARELDREFPDDWSQARDVLWAADATTGPTGKPVGIGDRVREVIERYGADHLVARCMMQIEPQLRAAHDRATSRLAASVIRDRAVPAGRSRDRREAGSRDAS